MFTERLRIAAGPVVYAVPLNGLLRIEEIRAALSLELLHIPSPH
jgi:hypothetical protein